MNISIKDKKDEDSGEILSEEATGMNKRRDLMSSRSLKAGISRKPDEEVEVDVEQKEADSEEANRHQEMRRSRKAAITKITADKNLADLANTTDRGSTTTRTVGHLELISGKTETTTDRF